MLLASSGKIRKEGPFIEIRELEVEREHIRGGIGTRKAEDV